MTKPTDEKRNSTIQTKWPERIDPEDTPAGVVAHHLKKYDFALSHVRGLTLDVACGVGYGSAFLTPAAQRVVGLDIDLAALGVARSRYSSERCQFVRADATDLPFADHSVDAVVCFEGIEHFEDPSKHVREVARVLRNEGVYLVSTPRKGAVHGAHANPYHQHEFDIPSFDSMLKRHFNDVTGFGQHRVQSGSHRLAQQADVLGLRRIALLRPLAKFLSRAAFGTSPVDEAMLRDFVIDTNTSHALELIGVCRMPVAKQ